MKKITFKVDDSAVDTILGVLEGCAIGVVFVETIADLPPAKKKRAWSPVHNKASSTYVALVRTSVDSRGMFTLEDYAKALSTTADPGGVPHLLLARAVRAGWVRPVTVNGNLYQRVAK